MRNKREKITALFFTALFILAGLFSAFGNGMAADFFVPDNINIFQVTDDYVTESEHYEEMSQEYNLFIAKKSANAVLIIPGKTYDGTTEFVEGFLWLGNYDETRPITISAPPPTPLAEPQEIIDKGSLREAGETGGGRTWTGLLRRVLVSMLGRAA